MMPIFFGRILAGGLLCLDRPQDYAAQVRRLRGQFVEVTIRRWRSQRSLSQNNLLWRLNTQIADELGYDRHEVELVHYALLMKRFGSRRDKALGIDVPLQTSRHLSTAEMADYVDWVARFAATALNIVVQLPGEPYDPQTRTSRDDEAPAAADDTSDYAPSL